MEIPNKEANLISAAGLQPGASQVALLNLKKTADAARASYNNELAIKLYTEALDLLTETNNQDALTLEYELLAGRLACSGLAGLFVESQRDLDRMKELALLTGDIDRRMETILQQATLDNILGNFTRAEQCAEEGLEISRKIKNRKFEAEFLIALGNTLNSVSDYINSLACHEAALSIYRDLSDLAGEALGLCRIGACLKDTGQSDLAHDYASKSYSFYRKLGDINGQAACLNILGIIAEDKTEARSFYEQALAIYQVTGDRNLQSNLNNNLGLVYWSLGLYSKARDYLEKAVQTAREFNGRSNLASYLESLGRIYLELEDYEHAEQVLQEGRVLALQIGERLSETTYLLMLGRVAFATGEYEIANGLMKQACEMQREMGTQGYLVTSLAWLGATFLAQGDWYSAYTYTQEATTQLALDAKVSEYPVQDIWWLHYQVLKAAPRDDADKAHIQDIAMHTRQALQNAYDSMLAAIATLSDDGLRRNYLNKVKINSAILVEYNEVLSSVEAQVQEIDSEQEEAAIIQPSRSHERLKRLLDISLQMNATLNPDTLPGFVIDNVIELSGAERGFLLLLDDTGNLALRVSRGFEQPELEAVISEKNATLEKVTQTRAPVLEENFQPVSILQPGGSPSWRNQRSAMYLPLLRRSGITGIIYADTHSLSGKFSQADVDLLSIFANQAATAMENARLFHERDRRITELSILDEIGRSLTSTLVLDELLETVYHQVGRIFDVTNFYIATYSEGDSDWTAAFQVEQGARQPVARHQLGLGLTSYIIQQKSPVLLHSGRESQSFKEEHGIPLLGAQARSWMGVPLLTADKIVGVMAIQSYEHENLYDEHALNLFGTIGSQVAIAIRNTRLYEEKSRANQELESFSYSVSHDLRAPIRAINGFTHILMDEYADQLDEMGKQHLRRVKEASRHMGELIDDILRLSRVTRSEIRRTRVDLSVIAGMVMTELQALHPERVVDFVAAPELVVNADANLMRILLENLLGNAWKFTQKHASARIELGIAEINRQATYFVRDDGAGFDMAYVNKLFTAFQRLHDASEFEGTGIGLATVHRIVQRHGGVVWAEGERGKGATFFFTIPG